jgi:hypothetical protein
MDLKLVRLIDRQSRHYRAQLLCWYCSATKVTDRQAEQALQGTATLLVLLSYQGN